MLPVTHGTGGELILTRDCYTLERRHASGERVEFGLSWHQDRHQLPRTFHDPSFCFSIVNAGGFFGLPSS